MACIIHVAWPSTQHSLYNQVLTKQYKDQTLFAVYAIDNLLCTIIMILNYSINFNQPIFVILFLEGLLSHVGYYGHTKGQIIGLKSLNLIIEKYCITL